MPKYRIPEPFKPGFQLISRLNGTQLQTIVSTLRESAVGSGTNSIVDVLKEKLSLSQDDIYLLVQTIFSITGLHEEDSASIEEITTSLVESYTYLNEEIEEGEKEGLEDGLLVILDNTENIRLTLKARTLLSEYDKIFVDNRIITDIRIIFNDNFDNSSQSAVIVHQLKIEYQNEGDSKQSFFALDASDLRQLKTNIERALEKEAKIRSGLYSKELKFIEILR